MHKFWVSESDTLLEGSRKEVTVFPMLTELIKRYHESIINFLLLWHY